jgi:hypothetical protein
VPPPVPSGLGHGDLGAQARRPRGGDGLHMSRATTGHA